MADIEDASDFLIEALAAPVGRLGGVVGKSVSRLGLNPAHGEYASKLKREGRAIASNGYKIERRRNSAGARSCNEAISEYRRPCPSAPRETSRLSPASRTSRRPRRTLPRAPSSPSPDTCRCIRRSRREPPL